MGPTDFTAILSAPGTPQATYDTINNVAAWWTEDIEGSAGRQGNTFTVRFGSTWKTFQVTELVPASKIVWTVTDCCMPWNKDTTEWTGTTVVFEITDINGQTTIHFTHHGLVPELACFDACKNGWGHYLQGSLPALLATGAGNPNKKKAQERTQP